MGSWFSNLSIRKNENVTENDLAQYIRQYMTKQQYLPTFSEDEADASFAVVSGEKSKWISVYSDLFSFDNPNEFSNLATPMSEALRTEILGISCFDSDYLYLNLVDAASGTDAWAGIGSAAGLGIKRRTNLSAWKNKTSDFPLFKEVTRKKYVFAEEALTELAPCLELPEQYSLASYEYLKDFEFGERASYLYFRLPDDLKTKEPPRLTLRTASSKPFFVDEPHLVSALNVGGESKGLSVYFLGDYVANEEISFSDVSFIKVKNNNREYVPIELNKIQLSDGRFAYYYHDPGFKIPPKADVRLQGAKRAKTEDERCITVRFIPHGNPRKVLDITVVLVPDKNPQGQFSWNVWRRYGSKAKYIEEYNKSWSEFSRLLKSEDMLLREEDFD